MSRHTTRFPIRTRPQGALETRRNWQRIRAQQIAQSDLDGYALWPGGPWTFESAALTDGALAALIDGSLRAVNATSDWVGDHRLGIVVDASTANAYLQVGGPADVQYAGTTPSDRGKMLFATNVNGKVQDGHPAVKSWNIYQVGAFNADNGDGTIEVILDIHSIRKGSTQ